MKSNLYYSDVEKYMDKIPSPCYVMEEKFVAIWN